VSFLLGVALVAAEAPARFWEDDVWTIYKNDDNCAMVGSYERDKMIWIGHYYGRSRTRLVIEDPAFRSAEDGKEYKLQLYFVRGAYLDDGWGQVTAYGQATDKHKSIAFNLKGDEALDDIARSDTLALMNDDVVVSSLSLKGSAVAIPKLRQCALQVHRENPSDPLLGAEQTK
jgi:hypothetical protein